MSLEIIILDITNRFEVLYRRRFIAGALRRLPTIDGGAQSKYAHSRDANQNSDCDADVQLFGYGWS